MKTTPLQSPQLAPPGAGLPWLELRVARLMFAWQSRRTTRSQAAALFDAERATIRSLAAGVTPELAARRVLIPRLAGLEDSSRFHSIYMVLDHLRIMNVSIADAIVGLVNGQIPARAASTAAVKPKAGVGDDVLGAFDASCDYFRTKTAALPELRTALKWQHPWFGPLDGQAWHFMNAFHTGLHRKQVQRILRHLHAAPAAIDAAQPA